MNFFNWIMYKLADSIWMEYNWINTWHVYWKIYKNNIASDQEIESCIGMDRAREGGRVERRKEKHKGGGEDWVEEIKRENAKEEEKDRERDIRGK